MDGFVHTEAHTDEHAGAQRSFFSWFLAFSCDLKVQQWPARAHVTDSSNGAILLWIKIVLPSDTLSHQ